jgi:hypothetical protein
MRIVLLPAVAVAALLALSTVAEAGGHHGCGCCGGGGGAYYAPAAYAPVAASPATVTQAMPAGDTIARNNQGYRSFSYQPATAAPAPVMNTGNGFYYRGSGARSYQPVWMNGANKSLGRVN